MIREVIRPQTKTYTIKIPQEYLDREIEILILPVGPERKTPDQRAAAIMKTSGILSRNKVDPVSWQKDIRSEWDNRI